jgi:hypothetical protein
MSINKKILVTAVAGLALGVSSCKKYLDVNKDPNIAPVGTVATLLPAAELMVGSAVGTDLEVNGSIWSQFWTQSPAGSEYKALDQYDPNATFYNNSWKNLYAGAENFSQLYNLADTQHKYQYMAIALLMKAYTFQALTDGWGDVPFKEALNGQYAEGHIVNPKYDSQRVVYKGIVAYIDSASSLMKRSAGTTPGTDDLIYGGDMNKWKKFGNTLRLRVLMRMSDIDPVYAQTQIDTMFRTNAQFMGEGDDAKITYGSAMGNNNPLYSELTSMQMGGVQQLAGSKTCIDSMNSNNDSRGSVFYHSVPGMGLVGVTQSEYDIALLGGSYSTPNVYVGGDAGSAASASAAVILLSSWESYFLQAEAIARGMTAGDDAVMFFNGIHASFNYYGNALVSEGYTSASAAYTTYVTGDPGASIPAGYWAQYPATGTSIEKVRYIITQKWFAMCGNQGFEAWNEMRRTGYPDFLVHPRNSRIGNLFPLRMIYPASEAATNSNYPGMKPVTFGVWWDKF